MYLGYASERKDDFLHYKKNVTIFSLLHAWMKISQNFVIIKLTTDARRLLGVGILVGFESLNLTLNVSNLVFSRFLILLSDVRETCLKIDGKKK